MTSGRNLFTIYPKLFGLVRAGAEAAPRNKPVRELTRPHLWTLTNPQEWCLFIPGRKINPFFALAEVVWMWSGKGGADFISFYNKSITQFLDKGVPYFHGSYGRRVRHAGYSEQPFRQIPSVRLVGVEDAECEIDQLPYVISKLQRDPHTRQAVVSLWDPTKDNLISANDHPCNNLVYFNLRNGKLNMTVIRRSNDLVWGVPYNMIQFSHLQALIAGSLNAEIGEYSVCANNLHYYLDLYPDTLHTVEGWADNVKDLTVSLPEVVDNFYSKPWDMRWSLSGFDHFVGVVWDPFEKHSRLFIDQQVSVILDTAENNKAAAGTINAFYLTRMMQLQQDFEHHGVPEYWRNVFLLLLAYHCRKAKAYKVYMDIVDNLPKPLFWLVQDFYTKALPTQDGE